MTSQLFDSYHPERHYMRGPGPKWHAKYDSLYQQAAPSPAPAPVTPGKRFLLSGHNASNFSCRSNTDNSGKTIGEPGPRKT